MVSFYTLDRESKEWGGGRANHLHLFTQSYGHTQSNPRRYPRTTISHSGEPALLHMHKEAAEVSSGAKGVTEEPRGHQCGALKAHHCISDSHSLLELHP